MTMKNEHEVRMLGVLIAACGLIACEASDDPGAGSELEELEELESRSYEEAQPIVLPATADTFIRTGLGVYRNDNYGCSNDITVGSAFGGTTLPPGARDASRALIRFDLDGLGVLRVRKARLELSASLARTNGDLRPFELQAHAIKPSGPRTPWVEGNGYLGPHPIPAGCTNVDDAYGVAWWSGYDPFNWQGELYGQDNDFPPDFDPEVLASLNLDPRHMDPGDVLELDVTALVNDWLAGRRFNDGIMLRELSSSTAGRELQFASRERGAMDGLAGPRLVVERLPEFPAIDILAIGSQTTLRWGPRPGATYTVYRGERHDFMFTDPDAISVAAGLVEGEYSETFVPSADPGSFYQVVENRPGPDEWSGVVGRISVPVRHTTASGYSKIPLCLVPTPDDAVQQMLNYEQPLSIHWWEPLVQAFATDHAPFEGVLDLGVSEFLSVRPPSQPLAEIAHYSVTGRVPWEEEVALPMVEGINAVVWPIIGRTIHASELLSPFQGVTHVGRWNLLRQWIEWYPVSMEGLPQIHGVVSTVTHTDFEIDPCTPVYVYIDELPKLPDGRPIPVIWPYVGKAWP